MNSVADERTLAVTADGMCFDYQLPLSMSDGAVHQLLIPVTPKPTEEMTS